MEQGGEAACQKANPKEHYPPRLGARCLALPLSDRSSSVCPSTATLLSRAASRPGGGASLATSRPDDAVAEGSLGESFCRTSALAIP